MGDYLGCVAKIWMCCKKLAQDYAMVFSLEQSAYYEKVLIER